MTVYIGHASCREQIRMDKTCRNDSKPKSMMPHIDASPESCIQMCERTLCSIDISSSQCKVPIVTPL